MESSKVRKVKVLILGANGMLGHKLYQVLSKDCDVYGTVRCEWEDIERFKFFKASKIERTMDCAFWGVFNDLMCTIKPEIVINCIGIIDKNYDKHAMVEVNSVFPMRLKQLCANANIRLIHISTDCVFSGKEGNYNESSLADASDVYGKTKYLGEVTGDNVLTIRTSIIGRELVRSRGLLEWFISQRGKTVDGFSKAIFTGFPTVTFAGIIKDIILNHPNLNGLYHIASNPIDKYTLLTMINDTMHLSIIVTKQPSYRCDRSLNASKFNKATGFKPWPWSIMLDELAKDTKQYEKWR